MTNFNRMPSSQIMFMKGEWDPHYEEYYIDLQCSDFPVHDELPPCDWIQERTRVKRYWKKYWTDRNFKVGEPIEDDGVSDNVLDHGDFLDDVLDLQDDAGCQSDPPDPQGSRGQHRLWL